MNRLNSSNAYGAKLNPSNHFSTLGVDKPGWNIKSNSNADLIELETQPLVATNKENYFNYLDRFANDNSLMLEFNNAFINIIATGLTNFGSDIDVVYEIKKVYDQYLEMPQIDICAGNLDSMGLDFKFEGASDASLILYPKNSEVAILVELSCMNKLLNEGANSTSVSWSSMYFMNKVSHYELVEYTNVDFQKLFSHDALIFSHAYNKKVTDCLSSDVLNIFSLKYFARDKFAYFLHNGHKKLTLNPMEYFNISCNVRILLRWHKGSFEISHHDQLEEIPEYLYKKIFIKFNLNQPSMTSKEKALSLAAMSLLILRIFSDSGPGGGKRLSGATLRFLSCSLLKKSHALCKDIFDDCKKGGENQYVHFVNDIINFARCSDRTSSIMINHFKIIDKDHVMNKFLPPAWRW